jgi:hypothetical protein
MGEIGQKETSGPEETLCVNSRHTEQSYGVLVWARVKEHLRADLNTGCSMPMPED